MREKLPILVLGIVLAAVATAGADAPGTSLEAAVRAAGNADEAWAAFARTLQPEDNPDLPTLTTGEPTRAERLVHFIRSYESVRRTGLAFRERFPQDPRRWRAVVEIIARENVFSPFDVAGRAAVEAAVPAATRAAWHEEMEGLRQQGVVAADISNQDRFELEHLGGLTRLRGRMAVDWLNKRRPDVTAYSLELERMAAIYPEQEKLGGDLATYINAQGGADATDETRLAAWEGFRAHPSPALRARAEREVQVLELRIRPVDLKFTAVDGREVDFAKLRGKVVLIDFWATWCGPCVKELPRIKAVYEQYREQGFEVVGIALERLDYQPGETVAQRAAKAAKARKILTDFVAREGLAWPQNLDEDHNRSEIAARYNIGAIPTMYLVDQSGRIVNQNARGEHLEAEVRRLLKL